AGLPADRAVDVADRTRARRPVRPAAGRPGDSGAAAGDRAGLADLAYPARLPGLVSAEPVRVPARGGVPRAVRRVRAAAAGCCGDRGMGAGRGTGGRQAGARRLLGADAALRAAAGHRRSLAGRHADHAAGRVRPRHRAALRRALLPAAPLGPVHATVNRPWSERPLTSKTTPPGASPARPSCSSGSWEGVRRVSRTARRAARTPAPTRRARST